ncbi:MAG TPA: hypothetical protein VJ917_09415 [Saprospiraceae bacterium]|nr:hypothetical protein [Saprospiraceae bacterium]
MRKKYKIIRKKWTESYSNFEERINKEASEGWSVIEAFHDSTRVLVILEKK